MHQDRTLSVVVVEQISARQSIMVIEVILALWQCCIDTTAILVSDNILVSVLEVDPFGSLEFVAEALQIPFYLVVRDTDLGQELRERPL